jgi:hypothetical protein
VDWGIEAVGQPGYVSLKSLEFKALLPPYQLSLFDLQ